MGMFLLLKDKTHFASSSVEVVRKVLCCMSSEMKGPGFRLHVHTHGSIVQVFAFFMWFSSMSPMVVSLVFGIRVRAKIASIIGGMKAYFCSTDLIIPIISLLGFLPMGSGQSTKEK